MTPTKKCLWNLISMEITVATARKALAVEPCVLRREPWKWEYLGTKTEVVGLWEKVGK
jgi:hypothetical protein